MRRDIFVSVVVPLENDLDILPAVVRDLDAVMRSHFGDYELIWQYVVSADDGVVQGRAADLRGRFRRTGGAR